jgi:hypothetical protein
MGTTVDHLAATYVTFVPGDNAPPGRRLEISVNAPPRGTSPAAQVVIRFNSGHAQAKAVKLNKNGFGRIRVPFGRTKVANVDVALINASTRYAGCFKRGTTYSCRGFPRDNDRIYNVRAHVL